MPTKTSKDQGKTDTGETPLFTAARKGHVEVVPFLVGSGADKDQGTTDVGATPLFMAAHQGLLQVVRILAESGANKDQVISNDFGVAPLLSQLMRGTLRLSNFWLGPAPSMTKAAMAFSNFEIVRFLMISWWCLRTTNRWRRMFFDYFDIVFRRGESEWPFSMLTGPLGVRIALKSETRIGDPKYITVDAGNGIFHSNCGCPDHTACKTRMSPPRVIKIMIRSCCLYLELQEPQKSRPSF